MLLLIVGSIVIFNSDTNNKKYFTVNGVKLAVGVDGVNQSDFPPLGEYEVTVNCNNITGKWNYGSWELELSNMTNTNATCNINFKSVPNTHPKLNTKIIGLKEIDGVVNEPSTDWRYEGKNPNNYVLFNNELWRIIGVFADNTHGVTGEKLTKIIRNESIGGYAWNKSNTNNWDKASLKTILNKFYLKKTDGTSDASCYFYSTTVNGNCDFTKIGLDPNARSMIQTVTWKLGGHSTNNATAETFYTAERGTTVYGSNNPTVSANIGLMYPSDYGYSVLASDCARTTNLYSYDNANCGGKAWLLKNSYEWTMTHRVSDSRSVFIVNSYASLHSNNAHYGGAVRPTAYLKSDVYVVSGTGTITDPYILGV